MKHLMTLLALVVAVTAGAQESNQFTPYNPDINGDLNVGSEDLLGLLTSYGLSFFPSMLMDSVFTFSYQDVYMNGWSYLGYSFCEFLEWEAGANDPVSYFEGNGMTMGFPADYDGEPVWYPIIVFDQELLIQEISECGFELDNAGMQIYVPSPLPNGIVF